MIDVLLTFALGLVLGVIIVYGRGRRIVGGVVTVLLGGVLGYLLFETLPTDLLSAQYLLRLTGSSELNLAYSRGGLQGLVMIAPYMRYYAPAVGAVVSLVGYSIAVLALSSRKERRRKR